MGPNALERIARGAILSVARRVVVVILDGASEPLGAAPTSFELARTPLLDRLASEGSLARVRTVAPWLPVGSESAIPALLGWVPTGAVDRGALEAAARGIVVGPGERVWRVDVVAGRADAPVTDRAACELALAATGYAVHRLAGHRLLLVGPPPLPAAARAPGLRAWPEGIVPPRILGDETVVIGAPGAAVGAARLMGARTVVPDGATGLPDSDLAAKAAAAIAAIEAGADVVAVHVGGPDEAAHLRDRAAKIRSLEHADRELIAPLAAAVRRAGGILRVGPDHGCDPETGEHDAAPVPWLRWPAGGCAGAGRLTERAVLGLPIRTPLPATVGAAA
jgi:2,3-bisphosphoglycerate-independent phosphoglycerate mutase